MIQQEDILAESWDVLIVMDAARADYTSELDDRFEACVALGGITHEWCAQLWEMTDDPICHIAANPVPRWKFDKAPEKYPHVRIVDLHESHWQQRDGLGFVDPADVTSVAHDMISAVPDSTRVVVHYLQPHAPYAAQPLPVPVGNVPGEQENDIKVCSAIDNGIFTWEDLQASYSANLAWVLPEALALAERIDGHIIITSDHGEALGENGHYGHASVPFGMIAQVPYLMVDNAQRPERVDTLHRYLRQLPDDARVMEIGRLRWAQETHAHSTKHIAECDRVGDLISVDINADTEQVCREVIEDCSKIHFQNCDSLLAIEAAQGPLDMLYLDGANDAEQTLRELVLCEPLLAPGAIMIIDDSEIEKGRLASLYLDASPRWKIIERVEAAPNRTFFGNVVAKWVD